MCYLLFWAAFIVFAPLCCQDFMQQFAYFHKNTLMLMEMLLTAKRQLQYLPRIFLQALNAWVQVQLWLISYVHSSTEPKVKTNFIIWSAGFPPVYGLRLRVSAEADKLLRWSRAPFFSSSAHHTTCFLSEHSSNTAAWKYGNNILSLTVIWS